MLEYDDDCKVWGVFCESDLGNEYSHGHFVDNYPTEAEAIDAWNTRAERTCRNVSDPPSGFYCSVCHWGDWCEPSHLLTGSKYTGRVSGGPNYCPNCGAKVVDDCD